MAPSLAQIADQFGAIADRFCLLVDSAPNLDRREFVSQVYQMLPKLIDAAIGLPDIELSDNRSATEDTVEERVEKWKTVYASLTAKLGDWNFYWQVFDPNKDTAADCGSLADDIADIYRDLKRVLSFKESNQCRAEDLIWEWRLLFLSHWGKHAIDALLTMHFRLQE